DAKNPLALADVATDALNDIAVGVNGTVSLGYNKFDKLGVTLTVPVGHATLMYEPGIVAFRGEQPNLFANTPLDALIPKVLQTSTTVSNTVGGFIGGFSKSQQDSAGGPRYSVDGSIAWDNGDTDWNVTAAVEDDV